MTLDARLFGWAWVIAWPPGLVYETVTNGLPELSTIALGSVVWFLFAMIKYSRFTDWKSN